MSQPSLSMRKARGFTLIEAIVALVVFSMAAIGIYGWINSNLITLNRIAEVAASEQVLNSAIERLKLVDMSRETQGAFQVDEYMVNWQADLLEPIKQGTLETGKLALYDLGLYKVSLSFTKNTRLVGGYEYRRVGYKKMRIPKIEGAEP